MNIKIVLKWFLLVIVIAELAFIVLKIPGGFMNYRYDNPLNPLYGLANFDGIHYIGIARDGYKALHIEAFFPGYPILIRATSYLTHNQFLSGLLISLLAFLASTKLLYEMALEMFDKATARYTILCLLLFPTSFYFGAVYTESLFLLVSLLCFKYARKKMWLLASLFALLSGTIRITGIFLILAVLLYYLIELKNSKRFSTLISGWPLPLSTLGIGGYMYYLFEKLGDPLYFVHVQGFYNPQRSVDKLIFLHQVFYRYIKMIIYVDHRSFLFATVLLEFLVALFMIFIFVKSIKLLDLPMIAYSVGVFILPTLTGTFSSLPRYVLVMFPFFIVWGKLLKERSVFTRNAILILSCFGLIVYEMMFIRGYFVG